MKAIDYLIVGFGLAGGLLAWELFQRGCRVIIIDNGAKNASQVAAGLVNPVTGRRFVLIDEIDCLLPEAKTYYSALAAFFRQQFYFEKPMLRVLRNAVEVDLCSKRLQDPSYRNYLGNKLAPESGHPFGFLEQRQTGYLLTRPLLKCLKDYFCEVSSYRQVDFCYRDLSFISGFLWQEYRPRRIIFCEGYLARDNPWFSWLPMRPVKGEILTIDHDLAIPDKLYNDGHWLVPVRGNRARVGATFERERIDQDVSDQALTELLAAAERLVPGLQDAKRIVHEAGVRPCSEDRHPLVGMHPAFSGLYIFNGFGAKGSVMIPWYCRRFADHLLLGAELPQSGNIQRYERTHFPRSKSA